MVHWARLFHVLRIDRRAVTSMEYGLIAGAMAVGLVSAMSSVRLKLIAAINNVNF